MCFSFVFAEFKLNANVALLNINNADIDCIASVLLFRYDDMFILALVSKSSSKQGQSDKPPILSIWYSGLYMWYNSTQCICPNPLNVMSHSGGHSLPIMCLNTQKMGGLFGFRGAIGRCNKIITLCLYWPFFCVATLDYFNYQWICQCYYLVSKQKHPQHWKSPPEIKTVWDKMWNQNQNLPQNTNGKQNQCMCIQGNLTSFRLMTGNRWHRFTFLT